MSDTTLLEELRELELRLLQPGVRADPLLLGALLHADFIEVGANGKVYSRDEVLAEFRDSPPSYEVWAQDFEARPVAPGVALLMYRTAHVEADGSLSRHVARSSLWQYIEGAWLARFHQGTLAEPFKKHAI